MSLLFNMLSRLVIAFLPRSKHLLVSWLQSPSAVILEPKKIKSVTVSIVSPSICREVMGPDAMVLVFWMLSFKPVFSLSSFTFTKRLFSSPSLSAISMVSSAYLRLLIFLLAILIPACASSSPAFHMMYSAYTLNKVGQQINSRVKSFPDGSAGKESACSAGDLGDVGSILGLRDSWRRAWQPTPVFCPGKSHGQRSLGDCGPWGHKELGMTEAT